MENPELNELCQKILGKSLDEVFDEFEKSGEFESANKPIEVMSFKLLSLPGALFVEGHSSKTFGNVFQCSEQIEESHQRLANAFGEEAIKITEKLGTIAGIKTVTNMKDMKEKP